MTVRAKVKLLSIRTFETPYQGKTVLGRELDFYFVYPGMDKDPVVCDENKKFWDASPSGTLKITIQNPNAANEFEMGKYYYLDFNEAPIARSPYS